MYAIDDFADHNLLGHEGFGFVHKAILASGHIVEVKQLKDGSEQGEREFQTE
ncbi:proline-rich receptor-like protein kinase PERK1-like, partial [Trifolium medium]|nr:proline-rich receptor-like protein kinase PERK1-like [Trifolium medium]